MPGTTGDGRKEMALCHSVDDLYLPASRAMIARVCAAFLEENRLTATELLYSLPMQKRLEAAGVALRTAADKAATLQTKGTQESVVDRMMHLLSLVGQAGKRLEEMEPRIASLPLRPGRLSVLNRQIRASSSDERAARFLVEAVLVRYLVPGKGWREKMRRLLALCDDSLTQGELDMIDALTGEIMFNPAALTEVLGAPSTLAERLEGAIAIMLGEPLHPQAEPLLRVLARLLKDAPNQYWRRALVGSLVRDLNGPDTLLDFGGRMPFTHEEVVRELEAGRNLAERLHKARSVLPSVGRALANFEKRSARLITAEKLRDTLSGMLLHKKILALLDMRRNALGRSVILIDQHLDKLVNIPDLEARLTDCEPDPTRRAMLLGKIQHGFLTAGFGEFDMAHYGALFDDMQHKVLRQTGFFNQFRQSPDNSAQKVRRLLEMHLDHAFTEGRCAEAARKLMQHYVAQPDFVPAYVAGTDASERVGLLHELGRQLRAAGITPPAFSGQG